MTRQPATPSRDGQNPSAVPGEVQAQVPVYCSWSGGKDCALALHEAVRDGADARFLLTMMTEGGQRSRSHGLARHVLEAQAAALGLPIMFGAAAWSTYDEQFRALLDRAGALGIRTGVFGAIDGEDNRLWIESVCNATGGTALIPLWQRSRQELVHTLLDEGFQALIVAVRAGILPPDLLGHVIDRDMIAYLDRFGVDIAGEYGEYHTLVVGGPGFSSPLPIRQQEVSLRDGVWFLDIDLEPEPSGPKRGDRIAPPPGSVTDAG